MKGAVPNVYGLILAGGESTRMGTDKGIIRYHTMMQREHLFETASPCCDMVFYSVRQEQLETFAVKNEVLVDQNRYSGPYNGMLTAHDHFPEVAWLVLACDLPFLNTEVLMELVKQRNISKDITALSVKNSGEPEPLAAIWEPWALTASKTYLESGNKPSPKAFLKGCKVELVEVSSNNYLFNANTLEDQFFAKRKLT